jgi:predicted RNA-binding Zn ribbon-like protein
MAEREPIQPGWVAPRFLGGRIALDFANTIDRRLAGGAVVGTAEDKLAGGYPCLLAWAQARGLLPEGAARQLLRLATTDPAGAAAAHAEALGLRDALLALFDALAEGRPVPEAAMAGLNRRLAAAPAVVPLAGAGGSHRHVLPGRHLEEPFWPVLWSAASLLAEGEAALVRRCQAPGCGWVFLDASRGRTRLWCSTEVCGNRVRARRHAAAARRDAASGRPGA